MTAPAHPPRYSQNVEASLQHVRDLLGKHSLLEQPSRNNSLARADRHALIDELVHTRHLGLLRSKLQDMHPADIAWILGALPLNQRLKIWNLVRADCGGKILIQVSEPVRISLIAAMSAHESCASIVTLDADEIADLTPGLPQHVIREVFKSLPVEAREQLRLAMSYNAEMAGTLMDFNIIRIRDDVTLQVVSRYLRMIDRLPDHTNLLYVVDREDHFKGVLPLDRIIVNAPDATVATLMVTDMLRLHPEQDVSSASQVFQRYDLSSVPVVDENGKLLGRLTINAVFKHMRISSQLESQNQVGLHKDEDIYAPLFNSLKNRWLGLTLGLCAAFFASRIIGNFEGSIEKFVALASLMPVVVGIAVVSARQTARLTLRFSATQFTGQLLLKELALAMLNGLVWGSMAGLLAYLFYRNVALGVVLTVTILLNQIVAALAGIAIPMAAHRLGRESTIGANVLLIAITCSSGLFLFLGLATLFLIH